VLLKLLALICDYHTCSRLRNFSDLSFRSLILNYNSKLSAGAAVSLFWSDSAALQSGSAAG